jgi:hypothetical protein
MNGETSMFLHDFLWGFSVLSDRMSNALWSISILCLQVGLLSNYIYNETYTKVATLKSNFFTSSLGWLHCTLYFLNLPLITPPPALFFVLFLPNFHLYVERGFAAFEGWNRCSCSANTATATGIGIYALCFFPLSICFWFDLAVWRWWGC